LLLAVVVLAGGAGIRSNSGDGLTDNKIQYMSHFQL